MMYDDMIVFTANDLKEWMNEFHMGPKALCSLLGVTYSCVLYWLQGKRKIPQTTIKLLLYFRRYPHRMFDF